jgi:hypothetical protein
MIADRQALTPFRSPCREHSTTGFSLHASPKSVLVQLLAIAWLKSSLHILVSLLYPVRNKKTVKITETIPKSQVKSGQRLTGEGPALLPEGNSALLQTYPPATVDKLTNSLERVLITESFFIYLFLQRRFVNSRLYYFNKIITVHQHKLQTLNTTVS